MKQTLLILLALPVIILSCSKNEMDLVQPVVPEPCIAQTGNPSGRTYSADSIVSYSCTNKHCGILPLSAKNYWVYQDSIFQDGVFMKVQLDTLRFNKNRQSLSDGLIWWEANLNIGLPELLYANDTAIFSMEESYFIAGRLSSRKEFSQITADSTRFLSSFEDMAAQAKIVRLYNNTIIAPAGSFTDCFYFEKYSRNYRKDQVYFKPGIGVIRYVRESAPLGYPLLKMQQVSNLVSIHME